MSSALRNFQQDPIPLICHLVAMPGGQSPVAGKSAAAFEELCWEVPLDHRHTGQGSASRGAGASRPLGQPAPPGPPSQRRCQKPSSLCVSSLVLPQDHSCTVSLQLQEFLQGDAQKGNKSVFFCSMRLGHGREGAPKACAPTAVPLHPHPRPARWGRRVWAPRHWEALRPGSPGSQSSAGPAPGMLCRLQPPKHAAVRARGADTAHGINLNIGTKPLHLLMSLSPCG